MPRGSKTLSRAAVCRFWLDGGAGPKLTLCETSLAPTRARSLCTCGALRARVAECTHRDRDKDDGGC